MIEFSTVLITFAAFGLSTWLGICLVLFHVKFLHESVQDKHKILDEQINKFNEITAKASDINNSHAAKLIEMQEEIAALNHSQHMLDNSIKMQGTKSPIWKN